MEDFTISALAEQFITNVVNQVYQLDNQGAFLWVTDPDPRNMGTVSEDWSGPNGLAGTYYRSVADSEYNPMLGREVATYYQSWNSGNIGVIMGAYIPLGGGFTLDGGHMTDVLLGGFANPDDIHGNGGNDVIFGAGGPDTLSGDAGDDFLVAGIFPHIDMFDYCGMETANPKNDFVPLMYDSVQNGQIVYATSDSVNIPHSELYGGAGNDTLKGEDGNDVLYSGVGNDTYVMNADSYVDQIYENTGEGTQDILQILGDVTDISYGKVDNHLYFYGNNSTCLSILVDWYSNGGVEYLSFDNNIYAIADLVAAPVANGMTYSLDSGNGPVHVDLTGVPELIGVSDPAMTVLA